jgi:hypothetical protein
LRDAHAAASAARKILGPLITAYPDWAAPRQLADWLDPHLAWLEGR